MAVILAGGGSTRMGMDKAVLRLHQHRLIDRVYRRVAMQADIVLISASSDYGLGLSVLRDREHGPKGPTAGLYAIWQHLEKIGAGGALTVPVDGPNLPLDLAERLVQQNHSAIACDDAGQHPCFGWWRRADLAKAFAIADMTGSLSLKRLAALCEAREVRWEGDSHFLNLNTPEDAAHFQASSLPI